MISKQQLYQVTDPCQLRHFIKMAVKFQKQQFLYNHITTIRCNPKTNQCKSGTWQRGVSKSFNMQSFFNGCFPSKIVLHKRLFSIKGCLTSKVAFHKNLSSIKGHLPLCPKKRLELCNLTYIAYRLVSSI